MNLNKSLKGIKETLITNLKEKEKRESLSHWAVYFSLIGVLNFILFCYSIFNN